MRIVAVLAPERYHPVVGRGWGWGRCLETGRGGVPADAPERSNGRMTPSGAADDGRAGAGVLAGELAGAVAAHVAAAEAARFAGEAGADAGRVPRRRGRDGGALGGLEVRRRLAEGAGTKGAGLPFPGARRVSSGEAFHPKKTRCGPTLSVPPQPPRPARPRPIRRLRATSRRARRRRSRPRRASATGSRT